MFAYVMFFKVCIKMTTYLDVLTLTYVFIKYKNMLKNSTNTYL